MRQKIILILVALFALSFVYLIPQRNNDNSLKECFEKVHDFEKTSTTEMASCFSEFKKESLEALLVVQWKKKLSPPRFIEELNKLWPTINSTAQTKLIEVLDQLKQKERLKDNLEYFLVLNEWLNEVDDSSVVDVNKIMNICQSDDYQACYDLLSHVDEYSDLYKSQAFAEFTLLTTAKLNKKQEFLSRYNSLDESDKKRWQKIKNEISEESKLENLDKSSSQNFELFIENDVYKMAQNHFTILEEALAEISSKYTWYVNGRIPVVLYKNSKYNGLDDEGTWVEALYDGRIRIPAKVLNDPNRLKKVALHELTHCMLDQRVGPLPTWFNEGVAQFIESKKSQTKPETVLSARDLESSFFELKNENEIRLAYKWSLYLVEELFEQRGEAAFWNFLQEGKSISFETNFTDHFKISPKNYLDEMLQE